MAYFSNTFHFTDKMFISFKGNHNYLLFVSF